MKRTVSLLVVGALGTLIIGGCANENVVKKDEAMVPSATTQTKQFTDKSAKNASTSTNTSTTSGGNQTPVTSKMDKSKQEAQSKEKLKSTLDKIYFDFDSYDLSDSARKTLTNNADYLRKNPSAKVQIEGNCDERGSAEYNIALGEKRAKAAMKYINTLGISENRLSTISYGKEKPADQGHDEAAWAKNRRDDFAVITK